MTTLKPVQLGGSGLRASQLCLGTMNFGKPGRGHQGDWTLGIDEARPIFQAALDRGLFYFDCADIYGSAPARRSWASCCASSLPRDEYVLATKVAMPMGRARTRADCRASTLWRASIASLSGSASTTSTTS